MGKWRRTTVLCAAILGAALPAAAQDPAPKAAAPKVIDDIVQCRRIAEPRARFECLDAAAAALAAAMDAQAIVVLDKTEVRKTRRSLFGFTLPKLRLFGNDRDDVKEQDEPEAVRRLDTKVAGAAPYGHGMWTLVLAEGGTWRTTEVNRMFDPSAGMALTIKRGALGNYLASWGHNGSVRVERVR